MEDYEIAVLFIALAPLDVFLGEGIVTKHGRPVAAPVQYRALKRQGLFGSMKGTVLSYERPFDPIEGKYDVDRDGVGRSARPRR